MELKQRRGLETRTVQVDESVMSVTVSSPVAKQRYRVRFEDVLEEPIEFTEQRTTPPIIEGVCLGLGLVFIYIGVIKIESDIRSGSIVYGAACIAWAALMRLYKSYPPRQLLQLSGADPVLVLYYGSRHRGAVDEFVSLLREHTRKYLEQTYGSGAPFESKVNQIERLSALKDSGAISESEYDSLKAEVVGPRPASDRHGNYI